MMKISLFGYGNTTKAVAKKSLHVIFYDDKCKKPFRDENGFLVKPSSMFEANYSDVEVTSPGIPPNNPLIKKAKNLMSDYDFFAKDFPFSIWISGTNGKTTTTQMMQHLLKDKGSLAGGNIGTAVAELNKNANIWILETSSFTLHYTNIAKPNIYVLLPISPDHLSWHTDMKGYTDAKLKPLSFMQEGEVAIVPKEFSHVETKAYKIVYNSYEDLAKKFDIDISKIKFKGAFLTDALLAMSIDKILFDRTNYNKINSFTIEPHRQEEFFDKKNRLWVNDTKATNIDATIVALQNYKDKLIHLIVGGDDKGVCLKPLFAFLTTLHVKIYAIGSNKNKLINLAKEYNIQHKLCKNLEDSVTLIDENFTTKEVALLSPASASLDEFRSYAHRGDTFKDKVLSL